MTKLVGAAMTDEEIKNAMPIAGLIDAHNKVGIAIEDVIERDIKAGLYKLKSGPRKEQVKLLADQGLSNRQIAKVLGVSPSTIGYDLGVQNATSSVQNATPQSPSTDEQIEKATKKLKEKLEKIEKKHKEEVERLKEQIIELQQEPDKSDFSRQIDEITGPLVDFIQHDELVKMLSDLEIIKNEVVDEFDMLYLGHVIGGLASLSKRALAWSERLTPTTDTWKHRPRR